jgi:hypothetical protein
LGQGIESVKVIYTAGYSAVPDDLKLALIDLVAYYYKEEYKISRILSGASMNNANTSSMPRNIGFPDHIKRVLDLYRYI